MKTIVYSTAEDHYNQWQMATMEVSMKSVFYALRIKLKNHFQFFREKWTLYSQRALILQAKSQIQKIQSFGANTKLQYSEMQVYSQWGEDGIIQYILAQVPIVNKIFIEFGVENYLESNTRFLLTNDNWTGLVIDGSADNISSLKRSEIYWRYELTALDQFVTASNIDKIISDYTSEKDIALLSIDIDGNDYWIWQAIDTVRPRIVICEYNSVFGPTRPITIPYDPEFSRGLAHYSNLYFGASISALCSLAEEKGYDFVGCNKAGVNAFFIRSDLSANLVTYSAEDGYVQSKFRESRNRNRHLDFVSGSERDMVIKGMPVWNVQTHNLEEF